MEIYTSILVPSFCRKWLAFFPLRNDPQSWLSYLSCLSSTLATCIFICQTNFLVAFYQSDKISSMIIYSHLFNHVKKLMKQVVWNCCIYNKCFNIPSDAHFCLYAPSSARWRSVNFILQCNMDLRRARFLLILNFGCLLRQMIMFLNFYDKAWTFLNFYWNKA